MIFQISIFLFAGSQSAVAQFNTLTEQRFNQLQHIINNQLPPNITLKDAQKLAAAEGGPGSINMKCVALYCSDIYKSCVSKDRCQKPVACVLRCSKDFDTKKNPNVTNQVKLKNCYHQCATNNPSSLFRGICYIHSIHYNLLCLTISAPLQRPRFMRSVSKGWKLYSKI